MITVSAELKVECSIVGKVATETWYVDGKKFKEQTAELDNAKSVEEARKSLTEKNIKANLVNSIEEAFQ